MILKPIQKRMEMLSRRTGITPIQPKGAGYMMALIDLKKWHTFKAAEN